MKLYTELEVRKAIELSRDTHQEGRPYMERDEYDYSMDEVFKLLTHIELPSDEEIEKQNPFVWGSHIFGTRDLLVWEQGAKWMRDLIQGGNK